MISPSHTARTRPAETAAAGLGVGGVIAGVSTGNYLAALFAAFGLVPGAITFVIANGGIRGGLQAIWSGQPDR